MTTTRPIITVAATLVVDKVSSDCSNCLANVLNWRTVRACPECGLRFSGIACPYEGQPLGDSVFQSRPDLKQVRYLDAHQQMLLG